MTYKKGVPNKVIDRWKTLNPTYDVEVSLDNDCISFLRTYFNEYIAKLFIRIPEGMYKADLWRLCKLYINGGIYADVDIVPHLNINTLDKTFTFYTCLSVAKNSIFQAFIGTTPRNPIVLVTLLSFLINNPYTYVNGPTYDMYNCLKYNLNNVDIVADKYYYMNTVKLKINVGKSMKNIKIINLHYFPTNIYYTIHCIEPFHKILHFKIKNTYLFIIKKKNVISNNPKITNFIQKVGWNIPLKVTIRIPSKERIYLFKEQLKVGNDDICNAYVTYKNKKILDSRDAEYFNNNKSW
jgi:hypothetical protein